MEEISLKETLLYVRSKTIFIIVILFLVVTGGTLYSIYIKSPSYTSSASIILSSGTEKVTQEDITISKDLSQTFKEIGTSRQVIMQTIQDLNLNDSYENIKSHISVSTNSDTVIVTVGATADDAAFSKDLANSVATNLINQIKTTYQIDNIQIFDEATIPVRPTNINLLKDEIVYVIGGIFLGFFLVLVKFYFSDTTVELQKIKNKRVKISLE